jgi:hypothetical protein
MSSWTHGAQANEMAHFSTSRTRSYFPLLIGEMLRRGNLLLARACLLPSKQPTSQVVCIVHKRQQQTLKTGASLLVIHGRRLFCTVVALTQGTHCQNERRLLCSF